MLYRSEAKPSYTSVPIFLFTMAWVQKRKKGEMQSNCKMNAAADTASYCTLYEGSEITGECMCWSRDILAPTLFPACVHWDLAVLSLYTLITIHFNILIQVLKHNNQENTNANICKTQCRRLK